MQTDYDRKRYERREYGRRDPVALPGAGRDRDDWQQVDREEEHRGGRSLDRATGWEDANDLDGMSVDVGDGRHALLTQDRFAGERRYLWSSRSSANFSFNAPSGPVIDVGSNQLS